MLYRVSFALFMLFLNCTFAVCEELNLDTKGAADNDKQLVVAAPSPNLATEPIRDEFSEQKAIEFLDNASLHWQKTRKCFTCHTNLAYLYARPAIKKYLDVAKADQPEPKHELVRAYAEELVRDRWLEKGPRWDTEVIGIAAALAYDDDKTSGELNELTRIALDRMWTVQRDDGGWDWLKCGWPPMESDDHYGATLAAIAAGVAPGKYGETEPAKRGMEKLRKYFTNNPPPTLHHRAMLLWAARYQPDLVTAEEKKTTIGELLKLQRSDGGWATASLGNWERADGKEQDTKTSDGYGTGFVVFVLRQAGVSQSEVAIQQAVQWLKSNQRQSGRWFTRSLNKDNKHFLSHAGSAFAVMALDACNAF